MGIDIQGAIECRPVFNSREDPALGWEYAIDLNLLNSTRDYDAFGCLFGVQNYAGFRPIAAGRGLPADASPQTLRAHDESPAFSESWLSWADMAAVDWTEPAEQPDARIHEYAREDGEWRLKGKSAWNRELAAHLGINQNDPSAPPTVWLEGTEWRVGGRLLRSERLRRRDAVPANGSWSPVWAVMKTLAELHGPDHVRLIVWFNQ